ncbi:hypothetical protein D9M69_690720 [compost metagenome]
MEHQFVLGLGRHKTGFADRVLQLLSVGPETAIARGRPAVDNVDVPTGNQRVSRRVVDLENNPLQVSGIQPSFDS